MQPLALLEWTPPLIHEQELWQPLALLEGRLLQPLALLEFSQVVQLCLSAPPRGERHSSPSSLP